MGNRPSTVSGKDDCRKSAKLPMFRRNVFTKSERKSKNKPSERIAVVKPIHYNCKVQLNHKSLGADGSCFEV